MTKKRKKQVGEKNMRNKENKEIIEGRLYDFNLQMKMVTKRGSKYFGESFITGTLEIATDEEALNVIPVHYSFVRPTTQAGGSNSTYASLKKIIEEGKTWLNDGKEAALKLRLTPSGALNDFYPNGGDQLVSQQRNEGGFISFISTLNPNEQERSKFIFDIVINEVILVEASANPDLNLEEDFAKVNGAIFDFKGSLLPFSLVARDSKAAGSVNYFIGLNASKSNPIFTKVRGEIVNTTRTVQQVIENAFAEAVVDVSTRSEREWLITWAQPQPYVFDETVKEELEKAIADRNLYLEKTKSDTKKYYEERKTTASTPIPSVNPSMAAPIPEGGFNFKY